MAGKTHVMPDHGGLERLQLEGGSELATLLRRLEAEPDPGRKFALMLPRTQGPCRFGMGSRWVKWP